MQIFFLFSLMHAEVGLHPLSWPRVAEKIRLATQRTRGIIGVIGPPNDLKAAHLMVIDPVWYSDDFILAGIFQLCPARRAPINVCARSAGVWQTCADQTRYSIYFAAVTSDRPY